MAIRKPLYLGANGTPTEMNLSDELPVGNLPELTELAVPATTVLAGQWPGDVVQFDGTVWRNMPLAVGSPGAAGVDTFYNASPTLIAAGSQNLFPLHSLAKTAVTTGELSVSKTATDETVPLAAWLYDTPLGRTSLPAGLWTMSLFGGVDTVANGRLSWVTRRLFEVVVEGMSLTTTGSGSSRTATAASGTPFVSGDANPDPILAHYLQTPKGLYPIISYSSATVVTIATPSAYVNESGVAWHKWKALFATPSIAFTSISPTYMAQVWDSLQNGFTIADTSKLGAMDFHSAVGGPTTLTLAYDGNTDLSRNSRISSTMAAGQANPMTTGGDLIYGGSNGVQSRLPNGSAGQILTSNGGTAAPSWQTLTAASKGFSILMTQIFS